jgi:hypothetical protein
MFAPNGSRNLDGTFTSTAVADAANFERPVSWGGISLERVYVEHDFHELVTVRAGHFLTPYGIWNIDHGSPAIIGTTRPYLIGEQLFPEHQTGLDVFGAARIGDYRLGYHATVSNGRNPIEATRDPDMRLAFGGRLELEAPWLGQVKLGASAYTGRATELKTTPADVPAAYDEVSYGADALWQRDGWVVQTELVLQRRRYVDGARALRSGGFAPNGSAYGGYVIAGHRFSRLWNAMPYAVVEHYHSYDTAFSGDYVRAAVCGLNFRPTPSLVVKAEHTYAWFAPGESLFAGSHIKLARVQAAWVF